MVAEIAFSARFFLRQSYRKVGRFACGYDRKKGRLTGKKAEFPVDTTGKKAQ
jgi:hypothetical protein